MVARTEQEDRLDEDGATMSLFHPKHDGPGDWEWDETNGFSLSWFELNARTLKDGIKNYAYPVDECYAVLPVAKEVEATK